jgi:hypothetical protein
LTRTAPVHRRHTTGAPLPRHEAALKHTHLGFGAFCLLRAPPARRRHSELLCLLERGVALRGNALHFALNRAHLRLHHVAIHLVVFDFSARAREALLERFHLPWAQLERLRLLRACAAALRALALSSLRRGALLGERFARTLQLLHGLAQLSILVSRRR